MPNDETSTITKPAKKSARKPAKKTATSSTRKPAVRKKAPVKAKSAKKKTKTAKKKAPAVKIDTAEDRAALKARNLEALKEHAPQLHDQLIDYKPLSKLVVEDGQPDVIFEGQYFYGGEYDKFVERQLWEFWGNPYRLLMAPLQPNHYDETAGKFLFNVLKKATLKKLQFHQRPTENDSYYLFILGLGLGGHMMELIEKTNCQALFIADPNPEFAYHSLEVYDWVTLFDTLKKRNGRIDFCLNNDSDRIADALRRWLRGTNPMSVDGATYFYHYQNPVFSQAMKTLNKEAELILAGLGFFYDETLMLRNTHHNLFSGKERAYMRPSKPYIDIPAFVVGNGPSLDKDMPYIRENMDKVIIISSGSALRPLLVNGITPDFHMETENIEVFPLISQAAKDHDLSPVRLVTSTTVDPKAIPYFDTVLYYFRGSLSPYPIFCDTFERCLINPNPTVVNASLSLAQEVGIRKIYLFGTDMGVKAGDLHHSKDAYHYTKGAQFRHDVYDISVPANFGGKSMTSKGLFWTLDSLGGAVNHFRYGRIYYNCSDGALIRGTIPFPAKSLDLPDVGDKKQEAIDTIVSYFPIFSREEFDAHWNDEDIIEDMCDYLDDFGDRLDKTKNLGKKAYLTELMSMLSPEVTTRSVIGPAVTFRGTLFMMMIGFEYYRSRLKGKSQITPYDKIARKEFAAVLEYLRETAIEEFGSLTKDALKKGAKKKGAKKRKPAKGRERQKARP